MIAPVGISELILMSLAVFYCTAAAELHELGCRTRDNCSLETCYSAYYDPRFSKKLNHSAAMEACGKRGGILVVIGDVETQSWIGEALRTLPPYFVGLYWIGAVSSEAGNWTTTWNNVTYTNWKESRPGKSRGCVYLEFLSSEAETALWDAADCAARMNYICEAERNTSTNTTCKVPVPVFCEIAVPPSSTFNIPNNTTINTNDSFSTKIGDLKRTIEHVLATIVVPVVVLLTLTLIGVLLIYQRSKTRRKHVKKTRNAIVVREKISSSQSPTAREGDLNERCRVSYHKHELLKQNSSSASPEMLYSCWRNPLLCDDIGSDSVYDEIVTSPPVSSENGPNISPDVKNSAEKESEICYLELI